MAGDIAELDFLQQGPGASPGYTARQLRKFSQEMVGVGVYGRGSYRVTFSAGLTLNISGGIAYIRGRTNADQGIYRANHASTDPQLTVTLDAAHATLPRIDRIILQVADNAEDSQGLNKAQVIKVTGVATSGATLDNLLGAVDPFSLSSPSCILLADVLVNANNSPALSNTNIRDRRSYAIRGTVPPLITDIDCVQLEPYPGMVRYRWRINGADHASRQSAALFWLPRRIPATHIRWRYQQDGTTAVGTGQSYVFAFADASGRIFASTAATAFGGAVNTFRGEVIPFSPALPAGTIIEAGPIYVFFGLTALTSTQAFHCNCVINDSQSTLGFAATSPNQFLRQGSGGVTLPPTNRIQDVLTDGWAQTAGNSDLPVPVVAFSVG
jgi:hypothetical protein